jgi:hypothetical protein
MNDPTANLISELRRGALVLSVLSQLQEPATATRSKNG